jgi:hypothetical protein
MTIPEMDLEPEVEAKARRLKATAPKAEFLSGRRTREAQSRAMAQNVARNREYIRLTYQDTSWTRAMQTWVDQQPRHISTEALAAGLLAIIERMPEADLPHLSLHLIGRAFDVKPGSCTEAQIMALQPGRFLTHEAGLVRWHCQW